MYHSLPNNDLVDGNRNIPGTGSSDNSLLQEAITSIIRSAAYSSINKSSSVRY